MKFVCDRCKTRYSISDDRVHGKILKIRCKNCANVITVREGMDSDAGAADPQRSHRPTTAAPPISAALRAPAALEEEWYVSIDGVQTGPLSLKEAQSWVAGKPATAELHCWSEGLEDWLPVEKVSHFRDLRKPRAPASKSVPPPLPEKPLFAATMAAIEKSASAPKPQLPPLGPQTTPAKPMPVAKTNGSAPAQSAKTNAFDFGGTDSVPAITTPPIAAPAIATAAPAVEPPPASSLDDDDDLAIGEVSRVVKLADLVPKPKPQAAGSSAAVPRVAGSGAGLPRLATTGLTGAQPKLSPEQLGMNVDPALAAVVAGTGEPSPDESVVARSFAQRHRRGMLALIAFSALLVLGVIGAVVFVVSNKTDEFGGGLRGTKQIDTSRPEDIVRKQLALPETGSGSAQVAHNPRPRPTGTRPSGNNQVIVPQEDPKADALRASEVEDMAAKQNEGTKRCYMRAQKGALGFEIADLKKIAVTLTVGKDGAVTDVQLSSQGDNSFGQCLIARIKAWRFRESTSGGVFRISLAFSS